MRTLYAILHHETEEMVYIGCAKNYKSRMSQIKNGPHGKIFDYVHFLYDNDKPFISKKLYEVPGNEDGFYLESLLIAYLQPKYNVFMRKYSLDENEIKICKSILENHKIYQNDKSNYTRRTRTA